MASSSVSQEDHDVEHEFALASRRAKVRSARANRTVNSFPCRAEEGDKDGDGDTNIPKYEQASVVLVEQNDASPKPICRGLNKDKRPVARGAHAGHAGKSNKGVRDRRKLREKRRSTGVMHLPSTESTGGSTGEDENNENSAPTNLPKAVCIAAEVEEKSPAPRQGKSESDLDADDEANNSGDVRGMKQGEDGCIVALKADNDRLTHVLQSKEKRIAALEMQISQLSRQLSEMREENTKLHRLLSPQKP